MSSVNHNIYSIFWKLYFKIHEFMTYIIDLSSQSNIISFFANSPPMVHCENQKKSLTVTIVLAVRIKVFFDGTKWIGSQLGTCHQEYMSKIVKKPVEQWWRH